MPVDSGAVATAPLDSLPVGFAALGADLRLAFANPLFFTLLGLSDSRPITCLDGLLTALRQPALAGGRLVAEFLADQFAPDHGGAAALRWQRAGGSVLHIASAPLPQGGRSVTVADTTSLVLAGQDAQAQAETLRSILEAIPHGVCVFGSDRRVSMFNRTYTQVMVGAPVQVGDGFEAVIRRRAAAGEYGPGQPEEVARQQIAFDTSRPQSRRRRRPNGTMINIDTVPMPEGGHVSVVSDITALTEAEGEVVRRAREMAAMLASIRHGILLWGADHRLIAANAMATELMGHPPGLLAPGLPEKELLDSMQRRGALGDDAAAQQMIHRLRTMDRSKPYVRQVVTPSGRVLEIHSDPVAEGGWVTTFSDVTEARRAEQEARRAKDAAEAANRAKSHFLATMSHELRTPLNAVIGFSEAMLREADHPSPARVAEFARQINEAGRGLLGLINIILDVAGIESGRFELAQEPVQIERLIRNAMRSAEAAAQAAELQLVTELPAALPAVRGDERRLMQVLNHLLSNAIKFTQAGGTVTVGARRLPSGDLLVFVQDTGMGIEPQYLERVFEPFTQGDDTLARRFQGAGLGLYLSRALVAGHGGTLALDSRVGEGTTARIQLPADRLLTGRAGKH